MNMSSRNRLRVVLNVRGVIFETYSKTLLRFPCTLLGNMMRRGLHKPQHMQQHFFNRDSTCFEAIFFFYQSNGTLTCPMGMPLPHFEEECNYFQLPQDVINKMKRAEGILWELDDEECVLNDRRQLREWMWNFLEHPNTSIAAWLFGITSQLIIWLSIISCSVEGMPYFQSELETWVTLELVVNIWFLTELLLRLVFARDKLTFLKTLMNLVDIAAVLSYFFLLVVKTDKIMPIGIFKALKFLRVFRLFRLTKHSRRLKIVGRILQSSLANFRVLTLCLVMFIFLSGSITYILEYENQDMFESVPASLWWACITVTSVGYGDMYPLSIPGRIFASCVMLFSTLTFSLPILAVALQFVELYPKNVDADYYTKRKKVCDGVIHRKQSKVIGMN